MSEDLEPRELLRAVRNEDDKKAKRHKKAVSIKDLAPVIYHAKVIEKLTAEEISAKFGLPRSAIYRAIKRFKNTLGKIPRQDAQDLVNFYENEIKLLKAKREKAVGDRWFIAYSKIIADIAFRIAQVLQITAPEVHKHEVNFNKIEVEFVEGERQEAEPEIVENESDQSLQVAEAGKEED